MGRHGFLCVDCHTAPDHQIQGRAFSVSVEDANGVACTDCHARREHQDARLDTHLDAVACQTCHIPTFAGSIPTKASWDWSKAGDATRPEDPHHYLKIKGEFAYEQDAVPEYRWFNGTGRALPARRQDRPGEGHRPQPAAAAASPTRRRRSGRSRSTGRSSPTTREPTTSSRRSPAGKDGYWTTFDWDSAFRLGAKASEHPLQRQVRLRPDRDVLAALPHGRRPRRRRSAAPTATATGRASTGRRSATRVTPSRPEAARETAPGSSVALALAVALAAPAAAQQPRQPHPPGLRPARRRRAQGPHRAEDISAEKTCGACHDARLHRRPHRPHGAQAEAPPASSAT